MFEEIEFKTFAFQEIKAEDSGRFSGYASAYAKDLQGDRISPGAFAQTIKDKRGQVPILYQHDHDRMPLGVSTGLAEDGKGLHLDGQLFTNTTDGNNAYELLKAAADIGYRMGMSIGFNVLQWDFDADDATRTIKEINLWEVSLTPFPAQPKAYVSDVKTVRTFERYLRDADISRTDAKRLMRLISGRLADSSRGMPDEIQRDIDVDRVLDVTRSITPGELRNANR